MNKNNNRVVFPKKKTILHYNKYQGNEENTI
jgi:hypothetical protein